ncbi:MAG: DUF4836 family protein [Bacteroidota bacterium]
MQANLRSFLAVLIMAALFTACSNHAPKEAKYIPKDITAVLAVDPKSLHDKLEKSGINMDTLINRLFKRGGVDSNDKAKFNEISDAAGINWNDKIYFFSLQAGEEQQANSTVLNLMGGISNATKFEAFLKKQPALQKKSVQKEKNYSFILINNESMISWNEGNVIGSLIHSTVKPYYDSIAMKFIVPEKANMEKELKAEVNKYFTQKESESLASVEAFGNMFKTKSDGYAFSSTNRYLSILGAMPLQLPKLEELVKDNYIASTLSFEEGRIVATATTYTNPFVSSILKKYAGPTVNLSLIENYPSENINLIMMASFNPEIFGGVLKQLEVEGLVNNFMEKTGFTSQDLYKTLKGDIAVVVSDLGLPSKDLKVKNDSTVIFERKPLGKMILNAPVGDPVAFAKIMNKAVEMGYFSKNGNTYHAGKLLSFFGMYVNADDKNLIIASDSLTYAQYISNKSKAVISNDALNMFRGKSTIAYFDIANTIKGFLGGNDGDYKKSLLSAKETFKDMIMSSENFDGSTLKGKFEIRLNNEKQNSLATLTSLFTDIAVDMRMASKKEAELDDRMFPSGVPAIIRTN